MTNCLPSTSRSLPFALIHASGQEIIDSNHERALRIVQDCKAKLGEDRYALLIDLLEQLAPHKDS